MTRGDAIKPLSRPLSVDDIPDTGFDTEIVATDAEGQAVAIAIGLPAVSELVADFRLRWQPGRRLAAGGTVKARITQVCVLSLEPFESDVVQEIDMTFLDMTPPRAERPHRQRDSRAAARRHAIEAPPSPPPSDGEDDPPDPIVDGRIDLGAVAVEFLTLALDFYPRKPGVEFHDVVIDGADDRRPSAFAALERLKDRS